MAVINNNGYVTRGKKHCLRAWWLIKNHNTKGGLKLNQIYFPKEYIGKKIYLKVELIKE